MAVFSSGYCKITGLSKAMPEAHYIPMMPALSQNEQSQLYGCKITMAAHMDHHYVPIIEFGKGKGPGVISCKITGRVAESVARPVPLPEEGVEVKRVHRFKKDLRYMEPFVSRLANQAEKAAMEELLEKMKNTSELDQAHYFVYSLNDRRTGKTGMVLSYEYEEAIRTGAIESILLSGDSNSLVVRIKDGPMCTIPMDKVGKMQVERLSEEEMIFDGRGPDREIIEQQRREKAAREKEDREQMAEYLAEMERKRKERELRKKEKMKDTMKRKMAEAEEAERRQKAMDEEIRKQYEEAARIREEAEAAKAAAREAMLARREKKDAEARAKRAEELAEKARLAEEQLQREEAERLAAEEARLAQEAAAANALAAVDPHDMSVNELLEHMRQNTDDEALLRDMQEAANTGMSSQQIADMVVTSTIEAIEEEFADPDEDEEEVEEEEEDDEDKEDEDQLDALPEGLSEEERKVEEEALRQLREEQLEMRRKEREAKRLARQRKREEQERKEEAKRQAKEARERKKREMMERMAAIYKADAEDEAERMKKPEKREIKPRELLRRKRPADIEIPPPEGPAEFLVRTSDGKAVLTEDELDEMSVVEGRISSDATGRLTPGRAVKTNSGIEFIAGRIITTEEGEVFEPGQDVELLAGPKFVPGQTVATPHGPQFVAGKTIGEGENIEFVPGHVVALGEDKGDIFVPGQVMETDEGPKFVPGSVYRCRRAGPLFVPGQLRDGEFVPGKIVETEDGPRFLSPKFPGHEEQFTYVVQSFDLDPAELDLVKFQYHTPEPSPVFKGQDIGESINLMQLAARGYQAKTIRVPEPRPPPPKSKRQIYENVRVTFLDCIDSAERARDEDASHILGRDALTVEARRLQRVLADDLDNPLPMTEVSAFLKKCLSLVTPTRDVGIWIDGFFGHNEQGIFRPMQRMRERKLSQKVSLQKTLADIVQEMETELEEAQKRDIVMHSLAKVMKRQPPLRTHVDDYRERWQEVISGILLTSGKVVLNDVFDTTAYRDEHCVKTVLDDIREKMSGLTGDPQSVDILEDSICRYIEEKSTGKVEELLCINKDDHVPDGDGQTQRLFLTEAANLALLENETAVAQCLRQCLETPGLVCLLPFLHDAMELLRTVTHLRTLSEGDERRQALLGDLSKNPGLLCDNQLWLKLVSGAILVTEHAGSPARRLRSARCVPDEAVALVAEFHSSEIDTVFRQVVLAASRQVHGLPYDQTDLPVMVVKNQFEGILPRHLARNVIDGRLQYLLVNEDGVKLVRPGMDDEKSKEIIKRQTAVEPNNEASEEKNDPAEVDPCKDKCTCYPDETVSEPREVSTADVPADVPAISTPRKISSASQKKEGAVEGVETCEDSPTTTGGGEKQEPVHEVSAPSPHSTPTHVVEQEAGESNSEECVREAENLETCKDSQTMHGSAADEKKETGSGESDLTPDSLSTHVVKQGESTPCAADDVQEIGQSEACKDAASFPESALATDEKAPGCETSESTPESSSTHVVKQGDTELSAGGDAQVIGQSEEGEDLAGMAECETGAKEGTSAHETGPTPDNLLNQDEDRESSKPSPEDDSRDAKDMSKEHGSPNPEEQDPENVAAASEEQLDGDKQMDSEMKTDQTEVKEVATKDGLA